MRAERHEWLFSSASPRCVLKRFYSPLLVMFGKSTVGPVYVTGFSVHGTGAVNGRRLNLPVVTC